jgi:D-aspartate ligase
VNKPLSGRQVLALGGGVTLISVLRVLNRAGASVVTIPDEGNSARRSRYFRAGPAALRGVTAETLASVIDCLTPDTVLFPCSDVWVDGLVALPPSAAERHPMCVAPASAVEVLVDKARFDATMARLDLPHPASRLDVTPDDLATVPDSVLARSFLKPAHSQQFFAKFGVKAIQIASRADAIEKLSRCLESGHPMLLQEYVEGPATNHCFIEGYIDRAGVTKARFARRRLRMYPRDFGNSSISESIALDEVPDGIATLDALFADLSYRGIFSAEFKYDDRTRRMKLLDVNVRAWWYIDFAARCGVDVSTLAVLDALRESVPSVERYAVGKRCVYPYYDFSAARSEWSAGKLGLLAWARSWIGAYQPVFTWSDPWPAWGGMLDLARRRLAQ